MKITSKLLLKLTQMHKNVTERNKKKTECSGNFSLYRNSINNLFQVLGNDKNRHEVSKLKTGPEKHYNYN